VDSLGFADIAIQPGAICRPLGDGDTHIFPVNLGDFANGRAYWQEISRLDFGIGWREADDLCGGQRDIPFAKARRLPSG
jgi:hypothetical protein